MGGFLLPKERYHQLLQLHSRFPDSGQEEAVSHLPHQAAPQVHKDSESAGPSGSLLSSCNCPEDKPCSKGPM